MRADDIFTEIWPLTRPMIVSDYTTDSLQFKYDESLKKIDRLEFEISELKDRISSLQCEKDLDYEHLPCM